MSRMEMFPIVREVFQRARKKKIGERAVDQLVDAGMRGVGQAVSSEVVDRVKPRLRPRR